MDRRSTGRPHKHISQACQNCRGARAKCNGAPPCERCSERQLDCAFAPSGDGRSSRVDFRYKVAELQHENWVLRYFVAYLQQASEQHDHELLMRLRRLSPMRLHQSVDALFNLTREVSSLQDQSYQTDPRSVRIKREPESPLGPSLEQGAASADEPGSTLASHEFREAERLAGCDAGLLLRLLRVLRNVPSSDRNLVLEASEESILSLFRDIILAGLPPADQHHLLGSPRARDLPPSSGVTANGYPPEVQARQLLNFTLPEFAILPLTLRDSEHKSLLGAFFASFLDAVSPVVAHGTPVEQIIGPSFIDAEYMLRSREPYENALTIAVWVGNVARSVLTADPIPPLAGLICITRLLRWMISPTLQHYVEIPEMTRPLLVQRFVPHNPDIDLCPHPAIRRALMHNYRDWFTASDLSYLQIQWPGSPNEVIEIDPAAGHRRPTEYFESYATSVENWSFGKGFLEKYPELVWYGAKIRAE